MADFSGPLTIHLSGESFGTRRGLVSAEFTGTVTLTDMYVDAFGMLTGRVVTRGTLAATFQEFDQTPVTTSRSIFGDAEVLEPVATFAPNASIDAALGFDDWIASGSFGPGRITVGLGGTGSFDTGPGTLRLIGSTVSAGTLVLKNPVYSVTPLEPAVLEGDTGARDVTFRVTRLSGTGAPSSVDWWVNPTAPGNPDPLAPGAPRAGTLAFAQDQAEAFVSIPVQGDIAFNADWDLTLNVPTPYTDFAGYREESLFGTRSAARTVILNDDALRQVGIVALDADKPEGDSGQTPFTFRMFRTGGDLAEPLQVELQVMASYWLHPRIVDTDDLNWPGYPTLVTIPAGASSADFTAWVRADTIPESDEVFDVNLWQAGPQVDRIDPDRRSAIGRIRPDDDLPAGMLSVTDGGTAEVLAAAPDFYQGPVAGPTYQYVRITPENLNIAATTANWFLHSGAGNDALAVTGGTNILDGGSGSNFLSGGRFFGADTHFVDARNLLAPVWSTVLAFDLTDSMAVWGINESDWTITWHDGLGAAGYEGATMIATAPGRPTAALTIAGFSRADFESQGITPFVLNDPASGSDYLSIVFR